MLKARGRIKNWVLVLSLIVGGQFLPGQNVKTVFIPDDIKVEENSAKETIVRNLSDQEIFKTGFICGAADQAEKK